MFLFGHLIWATGFMFLISWRGYWQELMSPSWAHLLGSAAPETGHKQPILVDRVIDLPDGLASGLPVV